ncbi:phospholipase [Bacillus coahuilensis p1.1.43]|uniref:Phospholipase n=1 Tax=Bacillus coahuilensis p1.1.43 TaxID=1150625 RepID=A0A147KAJ6_9BACI|nr:patatin-like phospholipase family protein [Bacillus coahuilensis]KUP07650.1 phospholipase [Bacillus coahuilensis p1.1.43]
MKLVDGVFEGGGVRGIAHVGAVQAIEDQGYSWNRLAGTSAGAIIAALLASGYNAKELRVIMKELDYVRFLKKNWINYVPFIGQGLNLLFHEGFYKNTFQEQWLTEKLAHKNVYSFNDLEECQLKIIVSDITNNRMTIFPDDLEWYGETEEFSVAKAVTMSCTIPIYFQPIIWKTKQFSSPNLMVDGGLLSNFPIWIFDSPHIPRWPTFGFHFKREETVSRYSSGIFSIVKSLLSTMLQAHDYRHLDEEALARTILIPTDSISSTDFGLTEGQKEWLYQAGYSSAYHFLEKWNFHDYITRFRNEFISSKK